MVHDATYSSQGKKIQPWTKAHRVKNLSAIWASQSLVWEDPQEKGMVTHSSILFFFFKERS